MTSGWRLGIVEMPAAEEVRMASSTRRYPAKLKFQVVLEAIRGEKSPAQIAKAYGVHANSIGIWRQQFLKRGPSLFEADAAGGESERRMAELERMVGKKEVEIALLKNFLARTN